MIFESKLAFARRRAVSINTVKRWQERGFVVMNDKNQVDVEASIARLDARPAVLNGGKPKPAPPSTPHIVRISDFTPVPDASPAKPFPAAPSGQSVEEMAAELFKATGAPWTHAEAARIKENFLAKVRQLEFDRAAGKVVDVDEVQQNVIAEYAKIRNKLLGLGSRLAHKILTVSTPGEAKQLIDETVTEVLEELTLDAGASREDRVPVSVP